MVKPLALISYENLLPGSQLVNRFQDLGYRVQLVPDAKTLVAQAEREKPLLVVADLEGQKVDLCGIIKDLRQSPSTNHIPVLAFTIEGNQALQEAARSSGATLVTMDKAVLTHLPQLLEQVLQIE
jgi:CheY-like chemotaxis protein